MQLSLSSLSLFHFRNHVDLRLRLSCGPVVLTGQNGSGKTNILEAISLLVPGRGMCKASNGEWQTQGHSEPWAVVAQLENTQGEIKIATGRDPDNLQSDRRVVLIDGQSVKSQQLLAEHVAMAWVAPDMDRVLAEGPSARRKLVDRMTYSFDPSHAGRVQRYEKALRERLRLLREGQTSPVWLAGLEDEMARTGTAIAAARQSLLCPLQAAILETQSAFPVAQISLQGLAEEGVLNRPALMVEDELRAALAASRHEDAQSGTCAVGPHRSDLKVIHAAHNCPADLCSTGEQKALLVALMLAYVRMLTKARGITPLFLLDDITAHLDKTRRQALFDEILALRVQAWLTGTDESFFASLLPQAQHFPLEQGRVIGAAA